MEPYKLRRWRTRDSSGAATLYTCARPGRSKGKAAKSVPDQIVCEWVDGLPVSGKVVIVSLLGRKRGGLSEFSYYTFSGGFDGDEKRGSRRSWGEWLEDRYPKRFKVSEYPMVDMERIPVATLSQVADAITQLFADGYAVVLVDSGGETRTGMVCG